MALPQIYPIDDEEFAEGEAVSEEPHPLERLQEWEQSANIAGEQVDRNGVLMMLEPKTLPETLPVAAYLTATSLEDARDVLGTIEPFTYLYCAFGNLDPDCWILVAPNGVVWSGIV